jgi:type I restriction enzyme S subunit
MSRLEQLIAELCPNGVEYEKFENVCKYIRGVTYKKTQEVNSEASNARKVLRANNITLSTNELNFDDVKLISRKVKVREDQILRKEDILICAGSGSKEHIGKTAYISEDMDYTFGGFMAVIRCCKELNSRFFFHILTSELFSKHLRNTLNSSTINNLNAEIMNNFRFPLPPLPVQQEIVRILDNFTELTARRKQYEYYRDLLLTFGDSVEYKPLGVVCDYVDYRGKTPRKVDVGIFLITAKNIRKGFIDYNISREYIAVEDYEQVMKRGKPNVGDVLITTEAPCGNVAQLDRDDIALAQRVIKYRGKKGVINNSYLKYVLLGTEFQMKLLRAATGGTVKGIKGSILHKLTIPVPPIEEQERIVAILDRFDALCNDLTSGIPAEIEARQKQYEYYRDKLLSFKEVTA